MQIAPKLGRVDLGDLTPERVRRWRRELLAEGTGAPTTAKAYRLLRAIVNTAVDDERVRRNPCRLKGADKDGQYGAAGGDDRAGLRRGWGDQAWARALVLLAALIYQHVDPGRERAIAQALSKKIEAVRSGRADLAREWHGTGVARAAGGSRPWWSLSRLIRTTLTT